MMIEQINVNTELFQWLNKKTDLNSSQVDLVDGFIFMLKKINHHKSIRLVDDKKLHPRFWRSHDRTFGYELMKQKGKNRVAHLYQFYIDVAFAERLVEVRLNSVVVTMKGREYLLKNRDEQLEVLFRYIW